MLKKLNRIFHSVSRLGSSPTACVSRRQLDEVLTHTLIFFAVTKIETLNFYFSMMAGAFR
jgi:hypothetical protein